MIIKDIIDEDFVNYKKVCMTVMMPFCNFKCGEEFCQNSFLATSPNKEISHESIIDRFLNNKISEALCFQGLEPIDSKKDLLNCIKYLRQKEDIRHDVVIYTGYTKEELQNNGILQEIIDAAEDHLIIKFGRYMPMPENNPHYDEILGVNLISFNQYAEKF